MKTEKKEWKETWKKISEASEIRLKKENEDYINKLYNLNDKDIIKRSNCFFLTEEYLEDILKNIPTKSSGVYMIGDFYIGKSINIRKRIRAEFNSVLRIGISSTGKDLKDKLYEVISKGIRPEIKIISNNTDDEKELIQEYYFEKKYPLVNKEFIKFKK